MGSGDPMFGRNVRLAALSASALSVLVLAGCGSSEGVDTTPAATIDQARNDSTPDLMGAAPAPDAASAPDGLLGGSPTAATKPVPVEVHPSGYAPPPKKASMLKTWRRPDGTLVTAMRPIPNPHGQRVAHHAPRASAPAYHPPRVVAHAAPAPVVKTPVAKPAPAVVKPKVVAAAPAPKTVVTPPALKPVAPPKVVAPLAKAPTPTIPVAAPAKPLTKIEKLQAAVAPEATKGAVLAAGDSLGKGEAGQVTLSLPASLGDMIKAQAAKLGLTKAAKKTSAYATLQGEGYEVTPNGKQTAVVKPGEPTTFNWQVKPGEKAQGQLKSEFGIDLNGAKTAQSFSLGEIVKRVAPMKEAVKGKAGSLLSKLNIKGLDGDVNLPGVGGAPLKSVLGGALVLLAVIILAGISRSASASREKAERRRKFRTLTDYGRNEMELDNDAPTTSHVSYVNPMVAAAGGALAGGVMATAFNRHDDHGHDAHDSHGHDSHGHDDHHAAHDDHGHAPDLHAEAHPEPHAPAEHVAYAAPAAPVSHDAHGHDDHGYAPAAHDDHGHAETEAHAHDEHAAATDHAHDPHHAKALEHTH